MTRKEIEEQFVRLKNEFNNTKTEIRIAYSREMFELGEGNQLKRQKIEAYANNDEAALREISKRLKIIRAQKDDANKCLGERLRAVKARYSKDVEELQKTRKEKLLELGISVSCGEFRDAMYIAHRYLAERGWQKAYISLKDGLAIEARYIENAENAAAQEEPEVNSVEVEDIAYPQL